MKNTNILATVLITVSFLACNNNGQQSKSETNQDSSVKLITGNADSSVISFEKKLSLQGISYNLVVKGKGSIQQLSIITTGLSGGVDTTNLEIDPAINAEIEDLDHDGFPELLVYTQSAGSGSYGKVVGFSPNKGKSLSQIYFPELDMANPAAKGYQGHDEFTIVESNLLRRFKTYESNDVNAKPTGKMRQITYSLKNGEASKKFVMNKMVEISIN